jgi:hypothetical protein
MHSRYLLAVPVLFLVTLFQAPPAGATFHLNEISKVMVGLNGNNTIQAVELKMLSGGDNFVSTVSIKVYDAAGNQVDSLGSFTSSVGTGLAGRAILCATENFASTFGITPDLFIKPGLLVDTGQVSFEKAGCFVNSVAYGLVTAPKDGTTSAPALPTSGASVLVRTVDDGTLAICPLGEDAAAHFQLVSATSGNPVAFRNNAGDFVQVFPTAAGVGGSPVPRVPLAVYPNPFHTGARIVAPSYNLLAVYDIRGRLVRSWGSPGSSPAVMGPMRLTWDGTDSKGNRLASGIYFVQLGVNPADRARIVLLR